MTSASTWCDDVLGMYRVRGKTAVLYLEKRMSETNYAAYVNRNHHKILFQISFEKFFYA